MTGDKPRPFEVRASYCDGSLERSATVRARTPAEAAALAVWRGYLPLWGEVVGAGVRFHYWDPEKRPGSGWPFPAAMYPVTADHACVRMSFGEGTNRTLLVEAKALD